MTQAVIISTARTPLCKSWRGALNMTHGATLGGHVVKYAVERAKLDPAEVEDVIMGFPEVADVGVIGVPDEKWGEVGMAIVVKAPGTDVTEEKIVEQCRGKLARYKIPKKVAFVDQLPRTLTGKILKKDLRARFAGT